MNDKFLQIEDIGELREPILKFLQSCQTISTIRIQHQFSLGYARSVRIIDELYKLGYIGPANSSNIRQVLLKNIPKTS